jgi:hypothetical protein
VYRQYVQSGIAPGANTVTTSAIAANTIQPWQLSSSLLNPTVNSFTGDGTTTSFTLSLPPASANTVVVTVNGITQSPVTNYSTNNTSLVFTSAPSNASVIRAVQQAMIGTSIVPIDGSVTTSKLGSSLTLSGNTSFSGAISGTSATLSGTLGVTGVTTLTAQPILSSLTASSAVATDASKGLVSVTNTGSGNNVLSASPTLTGTVAAASLSLSSLTSGRVPYATTSGLLTDSSNLTFSGTSLAVGHTSTGGATFGVANGGNEIFQVFSAFSSNLNLVQNYNYASSVYVANENRASLYSWKIGTTEAMTLDASGNLQLGTTSLNYAKLFVLGAISNPSLTVGTTATAIIAGVAGQELAITESGTAPYGIGLQARNSVGNPSGTSYPILLNPVGGVIGVGITSPNTWGTSYAGIYQNPSVSIASSGLTFSTFGTNWYNNSGDKFRGTGYAVVYGQDASTGQNQWYTSTTSGTVGGAVTFTQVMTLNASGFLGIGQTSPICLIDVYGGGAYTYARFYRNDEAGYGGRVGTGNTLHSLGAVRSLGLDGFSQISFGIAGVQVAQINSSGNLLLGTTVSNYRLNVKGGGSIGDSSVYAQFTTLDTGTTATDGLLVGMGVGSSPIAYVSQMENAALVFQTNATERLRIPADAGGITFPATQSASSDVNTLDDYEEGNWTPVLTGTTAVSYANQLGRYTKIGRLVTVQFLLQTNSQTYTNNSATFAVSGLPFAGTLPSYTNGDGVANLYGFTFTGYVLSSVNSSSINLTQISSNAAFSSLLNSAALGGFILGGTISYIVAT